MPAAAVGPLVFAALAWGAIALVFVVFGYEVYAVLRERRVL